MAQSIEAVLPRIRSLAKRYKGRSAGEDDLFSVGVLAVLEAERDFRGEGDWVGFAVCVASNRMKNEVKRSVRYEAASVRYDALSTTTTMCMLRKHALGGATAGVQDENAYVAEVMERIQTSALGKMLLVESLGAVKKRRRQKHRVTLWRALKDAKTQAAEIISED